MAKDLMRRRVIVIFLILSVAVALAIRIPTTLGRAAQARPPAPSIPVSVATVSRADVPITLSALGAVTAFNTVTVRPWPSRRGDTRPPSRSCARWVVGGRRRSW
jgi:multidrug efflux pump subunit AcrA (membrane-fusion protein)